MSLSPTKAVAIVRAVQAAKQRIPKPQRTGITYFSAVDTWLFQEVSDARLCPVCQGHGEAERFRGNHLRSMFPFLEIVDLNTIKANVHPNCRCYLMRRIELEVDVYPEIDVDKELPQTVARNKLENAIQTVPEKHLKKLRAVQVVNLLKVHGERVGGAYYRPLNAIQVDYDALDTESGRWVVQHEIGHHVYDDLLTYNQKSEWHDIWIHAKHGHDQFAFPTEYAKTNDTEHFAETYTVVLKGKPVHPKFKESRAWKFMAKLVEEANED
jgi:hypothetical protein